MANCHTNDFTVSCRCQGLFFLDRTQQRIFAGAGEVDGFLRFFVRDLVRINPGDADAAVVDAQHYSHGLGLGSFEDVLQDEYDEIHRSEIVVMQQHLIELGLFEARLFFRQHADAAFFAVCPFGHEKNYRLRGRDLLHFNCAVYLVFNFIDLGGLKTEFFSELHLFLVQS